MAAIDWRIVGWRGVARHDEPRWNGPGERSGKKILKRKSWEESVLFFIDSGEWETGGQHQRAGHKQ